VYSVLSVIDKRLPSNTKKFGNYSWTNSVLMKHILLHISSSWPIRVRFPILGRSGRLPKKILGGTFYARIQGAPFTQEFRGHLLCNTNSGAPLMHKIKSKSKNKIRTYTRNHPSQNESTDGIHARNYFLLITAHQITTPSQNKKQKTQIGLTTAISATHRYPRVKFLQVFSVTVTNPIFFHDIPKLSQIQSIN